MLLIIAKTYDFNKSLSHQNSFSLKVNLKGEKKKLIYKLHLDDKIFIFLYLTFSYIQLLI